MQFDEKVLTALEVLTDAAENDFELFRICSLVRDLIAPPKAEQVDEKHQRFNGVTYRKDNSGHYGRYSGIHVDIWRYYNGDIPKDYVVHHDDWNPANNSADNLMLVTHSKHNSIHVPPGKIIGGGKPLKTFNCVVCGKAYQAYDMGNNRYCSQKCRAVAVNSRYTKTCPICGEQFQTSNNRQRYCSDACSKASRRRRESRTCPICGKSFLAHHCESKQYCSQECFFKAHSIARRELRTCPICGKTFEVIKSNPKKCCSNSCAAKMRKPAQHDKRHCVYCGQIFEVPKSSSQKYCSSSCAAKMREQQRREAAQPQPNGDDKS